MRIPDSAVEEGTALRNPAHSASLNRGLPADEELGPRSRMRTEVILQHERHQLAGFVLRQVVLLEVRFVPVALDPLEDDAVPGVQEHLSATAGLGVDPDRGSCLNTSPTAAASVPDRRNIPTGNRSRLAGPSVPRPTV